MKDLRAGHDHGQSWSPEGRQWPEDYPGAATFGGDPDRLIRLTIPAQPRLLSLARLCLAGVAAAQSARIDEIDDLRMAVTEVCQWVTSQWRGGLLELAIRASPTGIEVCVTGFSGPAPRALAPPSELSQTILRSTVDRFDFMTDPVTPRCIFSKRWQSAC